MTIPPKPSKFVNSNLTSFKNFFIALFIILLISIITALLVQSWSFANDSSTHYEKIKLKNVLNLPEVVLTDSHPIAKPHNTKCTYWDCFNIYRCGRTGHDRIAVYVYPLKKFIDINGVPAVGFMSKEYYTILESIIESKYYTANPHEACLFIPSIDTLNQDRIRINITSKALQSLI